MVTLDQFFISSGAAATVRRTWSPAGFPLTDPTCWSCREPEGTAAVVHFHLEYFEFDNWLIIKFLMSLAGFTFFLCKPGSLSRSAIYQQRHTSHGTVTPESRPEQPQVPTTRRWAAPEEQLAVKCTITVANEAVNSQSVSQIQCLLFK